MTIPDPKHSACIRVAADEIREWLKDALPTPDVQQELMRQQVERLVLDGGTPREWYRQPGVGEMVARQHLREMELDARPRPHEVVAESWAAFFERMTLPKATLHEVELAEAHINRMPYSKLSFEGMKPYTVWFAESSEKSSESLHRREEMNRAIAMQESSEKVPKGPTSPTYLAFRAGVWRGFLVGVGAVMLTLAVLWYGVTR